jgi:hypothetical protein
VRKVGWIARALENGLVRSAPALKHVEFIEIHMRPSQIILAFEIDPARIVLEIRNFATFYNI